MEVSSEVMTEIKLNSGKKFKLRPARKPPNFNSRRETRKLKRILDSYSTGGWFYRLFRPRYNSFFWKGTHNGVFGPGGHTHWEFRTGSLALLIAIVALVLVIVFGLIFIL